MVTCIWLDSAAQYASEMAYLCDQMGRNSPASQPGLDYLLQSIYHFQVKMNEELGRPPPLWQTWYILGAFLPAF